MQKTATTALLTLGLALSANAATNADLQNKLDVLASEVQELKARKVSTISDKLSFGGYAEIIYEDYASEDESGAASNKAPGAQWDTLRNVIYVGYKYNEKWSVLTEIEIEHANEVFTEMIEVNYNHSDLLNFKAGLLLTPIGFINEMHEPPTYIGVKRPELTSSIIPSTWRQNGVGLYGNQGSFSYKLFVLNSMDADDFNSGSVRNGRQKGAKAKGGNLSYLARADYKTNFGLDFGATAYVGKTNGLKANGYNHNIYEVHAEYRKNALAARAVYAMSDIEGAEISSVTGNSISDKQTGYYVDLSYDLTHGKGYVISPYVRYEVVNLFDEVSGSVTADNSKDMSNITYGVAYKPVPALSFKLDYMKKSNEADSGFDQVNFGLGWQY